MFWHMDRPHLIKRIYDKIPSTVFAVMLILLLFAAYAANEIEAQRNCGRVAKEFGFKYQCPDSIWRRYI